ncbi:hypothetical protein RND81_06G245000 [Saponaria officinalis]
MNLVNDSNDAIDHGGCCIIAAGGKRSLEQALSQSQGYRSLQSQQGKRNRCEMRGKRQESVLGDKRTTCNRKWEEMNHEILICIMKSYQWYEWHKSAYADFIICKSWLSAFLDVLFPPGEILDLRLLDDHANFGYAVIGGDSRDSPYAWKIRMFYLYLKLNFDRHSPNHYTKLILSKCILHEQAYRDIAQRLPALKSFVTPTKMSSRLSSYKSDYYMMYSNYIARVMFKYWKNLEEAHCLFKMVWPLASCCKSIRNLTLIGVPGCRIWLPDNIASVIANGFPLLDRLSISSFIFSFTGISMILDCHKNLTYLDMTHTVGVPDQVIPTQVFGETTLDYPWPKDLSVKIASVPTFVTCNRETCPDCSLFDLQYLVLVQLMLLNYFILINKHFHALFFRNATFSMYN